MSHNNTKALLEKRAKVFSAFKSALTLDEMLKLLPDLEDCYAESELGAPLYQLALKNAEQGEDQEKTLSFAQRALQILVNDTQTDKKVMGEPIAKATQLCGATCLMLKRYDECLYYYNTASRLLNNLRGDRFYVFTGEIVDLLHEVEIGLFCVKKALGKREEAVIHLRSAMELGETILKHSNEMMYPAYKGLSVEYIWLKNYEEALHYGLKALELLMRDAEKNLSEIVDTKRYLGQLFRKLNEGEKPLDDSLVLEVQDALRQIKFGRYDNVDTLTATMADKGGESKEIAILMASMSKTLASMAKTLWKQERFAEAKRCLNSCVICLDQLESYSSPDLVVASLIEASEMYEKMKEIEAAIMVSKRLLKVLEKLPQEQFLVGKITGEIGRLLVYNRQFEDALSYLKNSIDKLKASNGLKTFELACAYMHLGSAYLALDSQKLAAQVVEHAKEIMEVLLGPDRTSLEIWEILAKSYATLGSHHKAIKLMEKVVEDFKRHGPSAKEVLDEAIEFLEQLKKDARNRS